MSLGREEEVKRSPLYIPPGYVAGPGELVVLFIGCLVMLGLVITMLRGIVEIPRFPENFGLQRAYVTQSVGFSKARAFMYFKVMRDSGSYDYVVELPSDEARSLGIYKFQKLWVALDASSDDKFVWAVHDDDFNLMVGREQIVWQTKYSNGTDYFMSGVLVLGVCYCFFNIVRLGFWNRFFIKKDG